MNFHSLVVVLAALAASPVVAERTSKRTRTKKAPGEKGTWEKTGNSWPHPPPKDDGSPEYALSRIDLKNLTRGTKEWFDLVNSSPAMLERSIAKLEELIETEGPWMVRRRKKAREEREAKWEKLGLNASSR
mmetsp:Transcript_102494/g.293437  ORF Transcript_102494/g.293437 Transcript_102494/m.293437 type:complete len:131 (+) Transcript_102494:206-598(+)